MNFSMAFKKPFRLKRQRRVSFLRKNGLECIFKHSPNYKEEIVKSLDQSSLSSSELDVLSKTSMGEHKIIVGNPVTGKGNLQNGNRCLMVEKEGNYLLEPDKCSLCMSKKCLLITHQSLLVRIKEFNKRFCLDDSLEKLLKRTIIPGVKKSFGLDVCKFDKLTTDIDVCKIIYMLFTEHIELFLVMLEINTCIQVRCTSTTKVTNGSESSSKHSRLELHLPGIKDISPEKFIKEIVLSCENNIHLCNVACKNILHLMDAENLVIRYHEDNNCVRIYLTLVKPLCVSTVDSFGICDPMFDYIKALIKD